MALIPAVIQWRWIWQLDGEDHGVNVLHLKRDGAGPTVDVALATALKLILIDAWTVTTGGHVFQAQISNNFRIERTSVRDIQIANQPEYTAVDPTALVGTNTADPLPVQTALVTTFRTALAGRSFRGRWYGMGYSEGTNTSLGVAQPALITAQDGFWSRIRERLEEQDLALTVASHTLGSDQLVTDHLTNTRWDTQRRRAVPGI